MKRIAVICTLLVFLFGSAFVWISFGSKQKNALDDYEEAIRESIPSDLRLTIYYIDPTVLSRAPIRTREDLMNYPGTHTIEVEPEKLMIHSNLLKELNAACLQPLEEDSKAEPITDYLRLAYVLEQGNGKILLEVMASNLVHGDSVLVNGVEVKNKPIFYEFIFPFLEEMDRSILNRSFDD